MDLNNRSRSNTQNSQNLNKSASIPLQNNANRIGLQSVNSNQPDPQNQTSAMRNAIGSHFFNTVNRGGGSKVNLNDSIMSSTGGALRGKDGAPALSKSQKKALDQSIEVEQVFDDLVEQEEMDFDQNQSLNASTYGKIGSKMLSKFSRKAGKHIQPSFYVHHAFAMALNVFIVLTAYPFKIFPAQFFFAYFFISIVVTFRFIFNFKSYNMFEYEDLYIYLKRKSNLQAQEFTQKKLTDPMIYYNKIIMFLSETFPGVHFEYKMQKRVQDSEEYLRKQQDKNQVTKSLKRYWKVIKTSLFSALFGQQQAGLNFIKAKDEQYLKYMKTQYWQNNENYWIYFKFLNLPIVIVCYFGGFQIVFIDLIFIYCLTKMYELSRAQQNGDKMISQTLQFIEKRATQKSEMQKIKNGQIVREYIKLKQRQTGRSRSPDNASRGAESYRPHIQTDNRRNFGAEQSHNRQKGSVPSQKQSQERDRKIR
eukprot:403356311